MVLSSLAQVLGVGAVATLVFAAWYIYKGVKAATKVVLYIQLVSFGLLALAAMALLGWVDLHIPKAVSDVVGFVEWLIRMLGGLPDVL